MPDAQEQPEGMPESVNGKRAQRQWPRTLAAVLIGLVGSIVIWVATPYNNFVIGSAYIADSFLPVAALILALLLVLCINPLLHWQKPSWALDTRQLALILGMMLVACVLPGQGLLRMLPYTLAKVPNDVRENARLESGYREMSLPSSLFPDRVTFEEGKPRETPVAYQFINELEVGASIPWIAWVGPLLSWGAFLLFGWLMMVGLSLIVLPQWRRNERLAFPLLTVQQALIEAPEEGHCFAPLFRRWSFWIAVGVVFLLHLLAGAHIYDPEGVPAIPLNWDLSRFFAEEPLRHLPGHIRNNRIYFIFLGAAFFMPNRIAFSIWFFTIVYAAYVVVGSVYLPPFHWGVVSDHRMGAMFAVTGAVLWLGRAHWAHVFRCLVRKVESAEDRRDRKAGVLFVSGCVGMFAWLIWVGVQPLWALFFVGFAFMVSLIITRIVAETGMPFIRIDCSYQISLLRLAPISWLGAASIYFSYVIAMLYPTASRVSCAVMATHAIGMDPTASPRRQSGMGFLVVAILVIGLVVCGAAHLSASYHHSSTIDGQHQPISSWGTRRLDGAHRDLLKWVQWQEAEPDSRQDVRLNQTSYNQIGHIGFGFVLAGLLQWACLIMPKWPLHPVGLLMVHTFYSNQAWVSVFLGWLIKVILLRYGGARLYRAARPCFLGLIMGEVIAAVFWGLEPAVRVFFELPYRTVPVLPF